jgi:hypothetical protein
VTVNATETRRDQLPFVGRDEELAFLERLTSAPLPSITFVNGIGGIGKSRILDAFSQMRRAAGATVVRIDCRLVEPTEAGFFRELGNASGDDIASCAEASGRLGELGSVVLIFDDVDALRLLDSWLRRVFVPALPPNVHVVFSGRDPPLSAWLQMPWHGAFRILELGPLDDADAVELLASSGIDARQATRVNRIACGHPLALTLAAITLQSVNDPALEDLAFHRMIDELARRHLAEITDLVTRRAVEAASIVRSITVPLLGAMLPDVAPSDAYERLRSLPLMRLARDGLQLHDTVRDAIARELRSSDPQRYLALRRACWSRLSRDLRTAPPSELWRHTADLLYLLENPVVREAFFPSGALRYAVEPARDADQGQILAIAEQYDGSAGARLTAAWWKNGADSFGVARDRDGNVAGYYVLFEAERLGTPPPLDDPVLAQWSAHLAANPVALGERVFFLRRWLSRTDGEVPCAVQAACWIDIKRAYMALRPRLRRVYLAVRDVALYAEAATQLGFVVLHACSTTVDGEPYVTAMLDFGPASVDGWFAKLVAAELGIATSGLLDVGARELVVGSRRSALTRREFDTLHYLVQRAGTAVHREEILNDVWGDAADVTSNVVDVVVRSLRKKLAERADVIETISGFGYRLCDVESTK